MKKEFIIGGQMVSMTVGAARRWNTGDPTLHDLSTSVIYDPSKDRYLTLRRATNSRLEPYLCQMLDEEPAWRNDVNVI